MRNFRKILMRLCDGRFTAALAGCLIYALGAMSRVAVPGMVFEDICSSCGFSAVQTAMLPSAGVLGCLFFIGLSGFFVDRYGWMRMMLVGALVQTLGFIPIHESSSLAMMLVGEFVNGGGRTITYLSIFKLFDVSFPRKHFSALIGIFYLFSYGGTLCASEVFPWLVSLLGSWRLAARMINICTFAGLLVVFAFIRLRGNADSSVGKSVQADLFPWKPMLGAFAVASARRAVLVTALNIGVYWSFLTVVAGPYARQNGVFQWVGVMNALVMIGMITMGGVSCLLGNRRHPFFLFGTAAISAAFICFIAGYPRAGFVALGLGYGVTGVLLSGTKESVPACFMASSIGLTNFIANILQVGTNQISGALMNGSLDGYRQIFVVYLVLALIALIYAGFCRSRDFALAFD